jgi:hypothetical protein
MPASFDCGQRQLVTVVKSADQVRPNNPLGSTRAGEAADLSLAGREAFQLVVELLVAIGEVSLEAREVLGAAPRSMVT